MHEPRNTEMKTRAQLGQLHSDLPARFAAQAGIGHSAYLEYDSRSDVSPLSAHFSPAVLSKMHEDGFGVTPPDSKAFRALAGICTEALNTRLTLLSLEREKGLSSVEHYRVFLASQYRLPPTTTGTLLRAILLFGDMLFPLLDRCSGEMHPMLQLQYRAAASVARIHEARFRAAPDDELVRFAVAYGEQLIMTLGSFLRPAAPARKAAPEHRRSHLPSVSRDDLLAEALRHPRLRRSLEKMAATAPLPEEFERRAVAPLDTPPPPEVDEADTVLAKDLVRRVAETESASPVEEAAREALRLELSGVLSAANDARSLTADPRPDQVERMLRANPFKAGKLQGNPAGLTEVDEVLGWDETGPRSAAVYREVLVPPEDPGEYEELRQQALPLITRLRRLVYPDTMEQSVRRRFVTSGAPDPARLPLFGISDTIFRRHEMKGRVATETHRPSCVLLACDASGSMKPPEISLLKLLTCAFAESLHDAQKVRVLAGAYHTARVGDLPEGPTVKWLLHPRLTPSLSPRQAARAVTALPGSGSGVNRDALCLTHMLDEVREIMARGTCYVIHLTDAQFNARDSSGDGTREMERLLEEVKELPDLNVHYTVVAIGKPSEYQLPGADRVLTVQREMLEDQTALAERIASFVARDVARRRREPNSKER
jgi:hypothetical protein